MGKKIAMIGAGSVVFCKTLMADIMATPALAGSEFALMSRTEPKLRAMEAFGKRMLADNNVKGRVTATLDRREALRGADFVVVMIQVGGVEAFEMDWRIPLKYKVDQCIGDSLGPGGVFRAMRSIPVLLDIARDMEEVSLPGAIMLQYANPMAANCLALGKASSVPFVGLCHGVQTTIEQIAQFVNVPKDEIVYTCGGINHMDWFLTLTHKGKDLYPRLAEAIDRPEILQERESAWGSVPALRLFHDGDDRPPLGVRALVPQEPGRPGPLLRRAGLRRGDGRLLHMVRNSGEEVRGQEPA